MSNMYLNEFWRALKREMSLIRERDELRSHLRTVVELARDGLFVYQRDKNGSRVTKCIRCGATEGHSTNVGCQTCMTLATIEDVAERVGL